jgi:hypothetical protein
MAQSLLMGKQVAEKHIQCSEYPRILTRQELFPNALNKYLVS